MSRDEISGTPSTVAIEDREKIEPDEETEEAYGSSGKVKATRKRYSKQLVNDLLDLIEEHLPYGNKEWDLVVQKFNATYQETRDYPSVRKKFQDMAVKGSLPTPQTAENMRADAINKKIIQKQQAGALPNANVPEKNSSITGPVVFRNISPPTHDGTTIGRKRLLPTTNNPPEGLSAIIKKFLNAPARRSGSNGSCSTAGIAFPSQSPSPPNHHNHHHSSPLPLHEIHEVLTDIMGSSERLQELLERCEGNVPSVNNVQKAIQGLFHALQGLIDNSNHHYSNGSGMDESVSSQQGEESGSGSNGHDTKRRQRTGDTPHHTSSSSAFASRPSPRQQEPQQQQQAGERLFFERQQSHRVGQVAEEEEGNDEDLQRVIANGRDAFDEDD